MSIYDKIKVGSMIYYYSGPRITDDKAKILCGKVTEIKECITYIDKVADGSITWDNDGCNECRKLIGIDNKNPACFMYGEGETILIDVQNELISKKDFSL
jgi:hypothetical protein